VNIKFIIITVIFISMKAHSQDVLLLKNNFKYEVQIQSVHTWGCRLNNNKTVLFKQISKIYTSNSQAIKLVIDLFPNVIATSVNDSLKCLDFKNVEVKSLLQKVLPYWTLTLSKSGSVLGDTLQSIDQTPIKKIERQGEFLIISIKDRLSRIPIFRIDKINHYVTNKKIDKETSGSMNGFFVGGLIGLLSVPIIKKSTESAVLEKGMLIAGGAIIGSFLGHMFAKPKGVEIYHLKGLKWENRLSLIDKIIMEEN